MKNSHNEYPGLADMDSERHPIDVLADHFAERCRLGTNPAIADYTERYPELKEQIERLFPSIEMMEKIGQRAPSTGANSSNQSSTRPVLDQVGDYRIVRETGRGGMGIVYEAVQESLGRHVAVKILARDVLVDSKHLYRFHREARTAARLHHNNIVPVFGVGEQDGYHYYVMQFIDGVGLDEVLRVLRVQKTHDRADGGNAPGVVADPQRTSLAVSVAQALTQGDFSRDDPLPDLVGFSGISSDVTEEAAHNQASTTTEISAIESDPNRLDDSAPQSQTSSSSKARKFGSAYWMSIARVGMQIADALHYSHSQGVLHRDIKPANLLVDKDGVVWVADFGLAKALEHDDLSRTGDIVGTLRYMSPEQFVGSSDHRSDIYSLGLTLYELVTLEPAHGDGMRAHLAHSNKVHSIARPRTINKNVPLDLETIVMKACAHDPNERYDSVGTMLADLRRFSQGRTISARRPTLSETFLKWCRRNPAIAGLTATAVALLFMVLAATSIGYIHTTRALTRESAQKELAQEQQRKTEETLAISLEALDRVYEQFAPDRLIEPSQLLVDSSDGDQIEVTSQPVISRETAKLLEEMLQFYERFSKLDLENVQLQSAFAEAYRRTGDIQQRLGAFDKAVSAYDEAIRQYQIIETNSAEDVNDRSVKLARCYNELGTIHRATSRFAEAKASHEQAKLLLEERATDALETVGYELARTYYLLGIRQTSVQMPIDRPPPRRFERDRASFSRRIAPPFDGQRDSHKNSYLGQAIELLERLKPLHDSVEETQYLLALCLRERARGIDSPDIQSAEQILRDLCKNYPAIADYRFQLAETLAGFDFRRIRAPQFEVAQKRLRESVDLCRLLVAEHPNVPSYRHTYAQMMHRLGIIVRSNVRSSSGFTRTELSEEAVRLEEAAVEIESSLAGEFPDSAVYAISLSVMQRALAQSLSMVGRAGDARSAIERSIQILKQFLASRPELTFVHGPLAEHNKELSRIFRQLGDKPRADEANRTAEMHERSMPARPMPRGPRRRP